MKKIRTGVIGVGYLGQFHAEKYSVLPDVELVGVVDADQKRAEQIAAKLNTRAYTSPEHLLGKIDAVSIVVPTAMHHAVTSPFLRQGIHVLLEKPVSVTLAQADELMSIADQNSALLQIGHIERFNPAVTVMKPLLKAPRYMAAERSAPFTIRCTDVNVILDLMIHDLDIAMSLAGAAPVEVSAAGASVITREIDMASARIIFRNGCIADIMASRVSDEKKRLLRVFDGDTVYASDYQTQKTFRSRKSDGSTLELKTEDISGERRDTLKEEIASFIQCVKNGSRPLVSGREGRLALALALIITESITNNRSGFVPVQ